MRLKHLRRPLLALAAGLMAAGVAPAGARSAEFDLPVSYWFRSHPHHAARHHARRVAWQETGFESARRTACISLACPGFIILGVGF